MTLTLFKNYIIFSIWKRLCHSLRHVRADFIKQVVFIRWYAHEWNPTGLHTCSQRIFSQLGYWCNTFCYFMLCCIFITKYSVDWKKTLWTYYYYSRHVGSTVPVCQNHAVTVTNRVGHVPWFQPDVRRFANA